MVFTKETWTATLRGTTAPEQRDRSVPGMQRRLEAIEPQYRAVVRDVRGRGDWDDSFIDTQCDPPETFSYGGAIAHVITFSAFRRELALAELRTNGVDMGYGDPIEWERERLMGP